MKKIIYFCGIIFFSIFSIVIYHSVLKYIMFYPYYMILYLELSKFPIIINVVYIISIRRQFFGDRRELNFKNFVCFLMLFIISEFISIFISWKTFIIPQTFFEGFILLSNDIIFIIWSLIISKMIVKIEENK